MSENKINYASRTYDDYKKDLMRITSQYYPDVFGKLNDAAIGQWMIELLSDMGDNLNFHIDKVYQETSVDSASQLNSLLSIARTNGLKITGRKSALCEIELSCVVPLKDTNGREGDLKEIDTNYCPIVKRGSLFSSGTVTFELMNDINFSEQFNQDGQSDRKIEPVRDSNGNITGYRLTKLAIVQAGQSKIYKKVITSEDVKPFMEIKIQDNNILGVESVLVKNGTNFTVDPLTSEFYIDEEDYTDKLGNKAKRFFEVDNLIDQYRYGYEVERDDKGNYNPKWENVLEELVDEDKNPIVDDNGNKLYTTIMRCVKGKWKRLKNKFITEYDNNWNIKVIFGAGIENQYGQIPETAKDFTQYMMCRMEANDYMGILPNAGSTVYVLYRVGGGEISNIAEGTLTNIIFNNYDIPGDCNDSQNNTKKNRVRNSFRVTNTSPSYGGKDIPSEEEIKYLIKYNNSAQNRCVTLHDYKAKINQLPAKYGCPFRIGIIEENNKVVIYTLGLNSLGKLTNVLSEYVANNIIEYLSKYKMMNDYIEMRSGKIINLAFNLTLYVDKSYDKAEVVKRVIDTIYDYMDIKKHEMGEDIFLGDLQKTISQLDGVINIAKFNVINKVGKENGYSDDKIAQELIETSDCCLDEENYEDNTINLNASDMILYGEANSMFEILKKDEDITINVKTR